MIDDYLKEQIILLDGDGYLKNYIDGDRFSLLTHLDGEGNVVIATGGGHYPTYAGPYTVTPKVEEDQVLDTDGKLMSDDVTVFEIPYFETSNLYGKTFIIGE